MPCYSDLRGGAMRGSTGRASRVGDQSVPGRSAASVSYAFWERPFLALRRRFRTIADRSV